MIKQYRKKPVVVEALQWTGLNHREMWDFLTGKTDEPMSTYGDNFYIDHAKVAGGLVIRTLEGEHLACVGDYIIRGVKGEFYPCKPDIFEATYEDVPMDKQRLDTIRARCEDCGLEYPFPDYVLPDDVWKRIAPKPDGNGLLCPTCIAKRLDAIGLWYNDGYYKPDGYSVFNPLQSEIVRLTTDRDAWRRRAEAAERDLLYLMNCDEMDGCDVCKKFKGLGMCDDCAPEWRGPEDDKHGTA